MTIFAAPLMTSFDEVMRIHSPAMRANNLLTGSPAQFFEKQEGILIAHLV